MNKLLLFFFTLLCMNASSQFIGSGYYHSLNICPDSTSQAWGNNSRGQLGNGNTSYSNVPVSVLTLNEIVQIDGGFYYTMALKNDGTVWAFGDNANGTLGNGTTVNSSQAAQIMGISNVLRIAPGAYHAMALKSDSTVWTWGSNNAGQLGTGNNTPSLVPVQTTGIDSVIAIAAGDDHCLAVRSDSTVWAWGMNDQGELGTGSTVPSTQSSPVQVMNLTGVVAVAGGGYKFSLALKADGSVWAWGYNQWGQLGNGSNAQSSVPVQVSNLSGITSIAAHGGQGHALALRNDSTVWAWGYNLFGQLGDSTHTDSNVPVQVYGLSGIVAIACGHQFSMALKSDGTVWAWGDNQHGQLGIGTFTGSYNTPVQVTSICPAPSSTNELSVHPEIAVYPNPSHGIFRIEFPGFHPLMNAALEVYNASGMLVYVGKISSQAFDMDLRSRCHGLCMIKISDGQQVVTKKVVIE